MPVQGEVTSKETINNQLENNKRNEEQKWQTVIGRSAAKSRDRQQADVVNVLNGFNLLAESLVPCKEEKDQVDKKRIQGKRELLRAYLSQYEAHHLEHKRVE